MLRSFIADECGRCGLSFMWKAMERAVLSTVFNQ